MPKTKLLKSGEISEETIHKTVIEWIRHHRNIAPYILHIPNEGKRSPRYGKKLLDLGLRPGVSDLFIAIPAKDFAGAWIELKSANGKLSLAQQSFLNDMEAQGYFVSTCYSINEAINIIQWYCFA